MKIFKSVRSFCDKIGVPRLGRSLTSLIGEPIHSMRAGLRFHLGKRVCFHYFGMNPKKITNEQASKRAILLLHGNYHNQSAWYHLAKLLSQSDLGPIYTVNLRSGELSESDRKVINEKLSEISKQYWAHGKEMTIDVVGHSRGSEMAFLTALCDAHWHVKHGFRELTCDQIEFKPNIGRIIRIGTPTCEFERSKLPDHLLNRIYEIDATKDYFIPRRSLAPVTHSLTVKTGHLGLLYSKRVHHQILSWLLRSSVHSDENADLT